MRKGQQNMIFVLVSLFITIGVAFLAFMFVAGSIGGGSGGADPGSLASDILGGV